MSRAYISLVIIALSMFLLLIGCSRGTVSSASLASRERYADQLGEFKERSDRMGAEVERDLQTILSDPQLDLGQMSKKVVEQFNRVISSIKSDLALLKSIEPPSDLLPLHQFFISDLSTSQSGYSEMRDSILSLDQTKINAVIERYDTYYRERKTKLSDAYRDSWLEPGDSIASLKQAIVTPVPGAGIRWAGLPINTWLIFAWFALACISTSNKRIWQAAMRGELPPGDEEPPGCLGLLIIPQYVVLAVLLYFDWQQALSVFVMTFLLASFLSLVMELIGMLLMVPFVLVYKTVRKRF